MPRGGHPWPVLRALGGRGRALGHPLGPARPPSSGSASPAAFPGHGPCARLLLPRAPAQLPAASVGPAQWWAPVGGPGVDLSLPWSPAAAGAPLPPAGSGPWISPWASRRRRRLGVYGTSAARWLTKVLTKARRFGPQALLARRGGRRWDWRPPSPQTVLCSHAAVPGPALGGATWLPPPPHPWSRETQTEFQSHGSWGPRPLLVKGPQPVPNTACNRPWAKADPVGA